MSYTGELSCPLFSPAVETEDRDLTLSDLSLIHI